MAEHYLATISEFEHPAPHRDRVKLMVLGFGLAAAPTAWAVQLLVGYAVASYLCFGGTPGVAPGEGTVRALITIVSVAALVVAATGALVSYRSWRRTRHETSGSAGEMIDVGRGRTRFLSMWGIMISLGFLVAIVFVLLGFMTVPLCGS